MLSLEHHLVSQENIDERNCQIIRANLGMENRASVENKGSKHANTSGQLAGKDKRNEEQRESRGLREKALTEEKISITM